MGVLEGGLGGGGGYYMDEDLESGSGGLWRMMEDTTWMRTLMLLTTRLLKLLRGEKGSDITSLMEADSAWRELPGNLAGQG